MTTNFVDVVGAQVFQTIGQSMQDCHDIASQFDNTCDISLGPIDFSTYVGETMSCSGQMRCPNGDGSQYYDSDSPCTFERKLCVTCSEKNGVTYIRVQNN